MSVNEKTLSALLEGLGEIGRALLALRDTVGTLARERPAPEAPLPGQSPQGPPVGSGTLREQLDAYTVRVVTGALARHAGNVTKASAELGVTREGLHKTMKSLGIHAEKWRTAERSGPPW